MPIWVKAILAIIWCIAIWVGVIIAISRGLKPYLRNKRKRKERIEAKISAKQGRQEMNPVTWQPEFTQKVLVFECMDGVERDFDVHDDVFDWVEEGDDGTLIYQGDRFVGFVARRPRHDLDKLHKQWTRS